jgi:hypothetical protein
MKKSFKLYALFLVIALVASSFTGEVKAVTKNMTDFSLQIYEDSKYNKSPYVSFEVGQTYALELTMYSDNAVFSSNLSGEEGFSFTSKDTSIVTVGKSNGLLTGKKVGSTSVVVDYPGLSSKTIDVTITPVRKDNQAQKDHETIKTIEELSKLEFKPEEFVDYYQQTCNLHRSSMTKKDHFIGVPNAYKIVSIYKPLSDYLAEKKALFTCINPINITKIKKLTSGSMTVELDRQILTEDLISYTSAFNTKYSPDMKLKVGLYIYAGDEAPFAKGNKFIALRKVSVGLNDNTITVDISNLLKSSKTYRVAFYFSDQYGYGKTTENDCMVSNGLEFTAK